MPERDDRYARNDLPHTTAEFRATPDPSASTAQFRAFASGQGTRAEQPESAAEGWPEQPWAGQAPTRGSGRTTAMAVGAILIAVLVLVVIVLVA